MKKLFLTAIITDMCMLPAISAENSAPSKYDVGKYNFNFAGEEVTIETKTPASETVETQETIEKPVSEIKTQTEIINQVKQEEEKEIKDIQQKQKKPFRP